MCVSVVFVGWVKPVLSLSNGRQRTHQYQVCPFKSPLTKGDLGGCVFSGGCFTTTFLPLYPIGVKLSDSWGGMHKFCLSVPAL